MALNAEISGDVYIVVHSKTGKLLHTTVFVDEEEARSSANCFTGGEVKKLYLKKVIIKNQ